MQMDSVSSADLQTAERLIEDGTIQIPLFLGNRVSGMIRGFNRFLAEPDEYRKQWDFWETEPDGRDITDIGYKDKGAQPGEDAKHIFHVSPDLERLLFARGVDISRHEYLLGYGRNIFTACWREYKHLLRALDHVLPGYNFYERAHSPRASKGSILRLLRYKDIKKEVIGKGHTDRNLITLHLTDSHPGLRLGKEGHLYLTSPGYALVFFGDKMEKITNGHIPALWHYVTDERAPSDKTLRWAMIFFGHVPQ
jgi:hypothetical protein